MSPIVSQYANACAQAVVARVGKDVRIAVPIGIGKPIALLDALTNDTALTIPWSSFHRMG